jgi:hypothetical protein
MWLAGGGALLLALSLTGVVAAAALVSAISPPPTETAEPAVVADTTRTFEDVDGDGVDDDCDDHVIADPAAAAAAEAAVDLDGNGVVSTSEAAQSNRIGGKNCNHGGYVSSVAHGPDEPTEDADEPTEDVDEPDEDGVKPAKDAKAKAECVTETEPADEAPADEAPVDTAPNAHGKAVSDVAHDKDAVGGKNCNHGGAVSEAAKKDQAAKDAAKEAAKAEKADKASKAEKSKGKGKKHGD